MTIAQQDSEGAVLVLLFPVIPNVESLVGTPVLRIRIASYLWIALMSHESLDAVEFADSGACCDGKGHHDDVGGQV